MTTALLPTPDPRPPRQGRRIVLRVLAALAIAGVIAAASTATKQAAAPLAAGGEGAAAPTDAGTAPTRTTTAVGGDATADGSSVVALPEDAPVAEPSEAAPPPDTTPPALDVPAVVELDDYEPLTLDLGIDDATEVLVDGGEVVLHDDGTATATFDVPPTALTVTATDAAGNTATAHVPVVVSFPGGQAVHTTPSAWRYAPKREPIIALLESGQIDAVQMDIKDELGDVSWDTDVEWADLSGAEDFNRNFDMAAAIDTIHSYGARVIGRLTVYRDHRLAQWAWENGRGDLVVQNTSGTPYAGRYGDYAFTNFAHPEVQQYNLDIALEAAELGFDDILYDYIRRPDGTIDKLVIPGLGDRTPEEAVVEVVARAYPLLRERGVWVGASVFGIAIDRPTQMAQDIPMMAEHVDYIAPMVYPNHWNLGEYGVPVPEAAPYDIVERSLALYRDVLEPTGTALMPWLQDFGGYGEAEVRAQIDATEAVTGRRDFLLWASSATYTEAALDPIEGAPAMRTP